MLLFLRSTINILETRINSQHCLSVYRTYPGNWYIIALIILLFILLTSHIFVAPSIKTRLRFILAQTEMVKYQFCKYPEGLKHSGDKHSLRRPVVKRWVLGPAETRTSKCLFSIILLLSVLRIGFGPWNCLVAGATVTFDWSLMVPIRPPNSMKTLQIMAPRCYDYKWSPFSIKHFTEHWSHGC